MPQNQPFDDSLPPFYVGTGGDHPGVCLVREQRKPEQVVSTMSGQSVYALAQSPDGTKLIVGTRDRQRNDQLGRVYIWERHRDGSLSESPLLSCFQPSSVTGVAMATSAVGVSGGLDGALRFWQVDEPNTSVAEVQAHQAPILAVSCLSSQIAFTIGADGFGRIWDLDRLEVVQEFSDTGDASVRGLLSIEPASDTGQVLGLYPSGTVRAHDLRDEDVRTTPVSVPYGSTAAVTLVGRRIVMADQHSPRLRVLALDDEHADPKTATCPSRVLALEALDVRRVLVMYRDGSGAVWNVEEAPTEERPLDLQDIRCAAGPPRRFQLAQGWKQRSSRRASLLEQAKRKLDARRVSDLQPHLHALAEEGMGVEALVLLAEWTRRNDKPLWELQTRFRLVDQLPEEPWCATHYYTLGTLLEQLDEPVEAKRYYEAAERSQTGYRDAKDRLQMLPDERGIPDGAVREEEIDDPSRYVLRIEKYALFNRPWTHPVTVVREEEDLKTSTSLSLSDVGSYLPEDMWSVKERQFLVDGTSTRSARCLEHRDPNGAEEFVYAACFQRISGRVHLIHRFWVPAPMPTMEENPLQAGREAHRFANDVKSNIEKITSASFRKRRESLKDCVRDAIDRAFQQSRRQKTTPEF
jgi:hypothetical protein